ncbi:MAG TPA: heat-shock protein [Mariprofundaceae bacterium]|nr:heat-shock protein [Mariprofundaceae bacterium]
MNTLLLALAAASIVVLMVALLLRQQVRQDNVEQQEDERVLPLLRGINFLLADEPDRALQQMVQVARLRSEAADVYLALGEMFRAKGEIGRAVRIHQNLLARPDLPAALRLQARLALAKDFQTGGLIDRALREYGKALSVKPDELVALEASLRLREQSSEWEKAEELLSRIEHVHGESSHLHRAYLVAEMARMEKNRHHWAKAVEYAQKALDLDGHCALAYLVMMDVRLSQHNEAQAAEAAEALWLHAPEHFPLAIPSMTAHQDFHDAHGQALLSRAWQSGHDEQLALAWIEAVSERQGTAAARKIAVETGYQPKGLRASLRLEAAVGSGDAPLQMHVRDWRKKLKIFCCVHCGLEVVEMRWQCPQCHTWGSMQVKREGEL